MQRQFPIPRNYAEWHYCITVECGLKLTPDFIRARLAALQNNADVHTRQFRQCYGADHHRQVISWFKQATETTSS